MKKENKWHKWIKPIPTSFCPGCLYGAILNCLAKAFEEMEIKPFEISAISGIGCAGWITDRYLKTDTMHTTHGRPIAFATGIKLAQPNLNVIVVGGDGDLATIGTNHLIHAARRNINISVFCVNNFLYGMTGGQMGSTTPYNAITSTSPTGNPEQPLDLIKTILASGCLLAGRFPVLTTNPSIIINAIKRSIKHEGFSFIEFISPCATHFTKKNRIFSPADMKKYLEERYVSKNQIKKIPQENKKDKIICGIFENLTEYLFISGEKL